MGRHGLVPARRCYDRDRVFDRIENQDQCRADEDSVRNADPVVAGRRQVFNQANDVVTKIAEHAGRHRRQAVRKGDAAFDKEASQRNERRVVEGREGPGLGLRNAIDLRPATIDAKYDIRIQADNRVAPTDRTVFD